MPNPLSVEKFSGEYFQTKHQKNENNYIFTFSNVQSSTCTWHATITAPLEPRGFHWAPEAYLRAFIALWAASKAQE